MKDHTNRFNSPPCAADELDTGKGRVTQFSDLSPSLIFFLLSASVGVAMTGLGIIWPLVPVYAVQLGASGLQVGLIIAAFNITRTLFNPFSGRFQTVGVENLLLFQGFFSIQWYRFFMFFQHRLRCLFLSVSSTDLPQCWSSPLPWH